MPILLALLGFLLQTPAPASPLQPAAGNPVVVIETSTGAITAELYKDRAPVSVENFLQYARDGHYAGTLWHRVVPGYVIQGGGYTPEMVEKPTRPPIQNEATNGTPFQIKGASFNYSFIIYQLSHSQLHIYWQRVNITGMFLQYY